MNADRGLFPMRNAGAARGQRCARPALRAATTGDCGRRKAELDRGLHGLTRIKGLSHPRPSVLSVVSFCGLRALRAATAGDCGTRKAEGREVELGNQELKKGAFQ